MRALRTIFVTLTFISLAAAQPFQINSPSPDLERWMYPNNLTPCDRIASSTFGTFGDESGVDSRHAQNLIGWNTALLVPTNQPPTHYLIRSCRITLLINRGNIFVYDPTHDDYRTYFETNDVGYLPDSDAGRPVELFGAGFRNGFDVFTYDNCAPFGSSAPGERNAYATGWFTNGTLVDVGNNVGKTNSAFPRFEVWPFAVGQTTNVAPGQLVPAAAKITYDLNLADPFVVTYLQNGLSTGLLRFMVSSLHVTAGQFGQPAYPDFVTHFSEVAINPTRLELDGTAVRPLDTDNDGLPDDWEQFYFTNLVQTAMGDFDNDGANNRAEYLAGTNPTQATSAFGITSIQINSGRCELRWPNLPSRRFEIDYSDNLTSWQTLTNPPVSFPTPTHAVWSETTSVATRLYRVRAVAL